MDKIWDENPSKSEVIGHFGGDEKTNDYAESTKVDRKKRVKKKTQSLRHSCGKDISSSVDKLNPEPLGI